LVFVSGTHPQFSSRSHIDGVASNNDEMALGALMAIKAVGKLGKIPVGGTDGSHDALASLDKGELNNTVFQDPVGQGVEAVNAAYLMVSNSSSAILDAGQLPGHLTPCGWHRTH
jgi:ABC-type sugar transport system substrate-binding protein